MEPALQPGDWLLVWRGLGRSLVAVRPGQLVIARHPDRLDLLLVKRAARLDPAGWWLISDNSGVGEVDSRSLGAVRPDLIQGRVLLRYWPIRRS